MNELVKSVSGERVPGRGNSLGKGPEARKRVAMVFLKNRKKTSVAAGTRERGRGNAEVEVMNRHELKQT